MGLHQLTADEQIVLAEIHRRGRATANDVWEAYSERFFLSQVRSILKRLVEASAAEETGEYFVLEDNPYYRLTERGRCAAKKLPVRTGLQPHEPLEV